MKLSTLHFTGKLLTTWSIAVAVWMIGINATFIVNPRDKLIAWRTREEGTASIAVTIGGSGDEPFKSVTICVAVLASWYVWSRCCRDHFA
jgi:hypothetical protein